MKVWQRVLIGAFFAALLGAAVEWGGRRSASLLTAILVFATAVYVDRTHEMVREMRAARSAQLRPKLIVAMDRFAARAMTPKVLSVGAGAAFAVDVSVTLEPNGPSGPFAASVLGVGRGQSLLFRDPKSQVVLASVTDFKRYERVSLKGNCKDALGVSVEVDDTLNLSSYIAAYEAGLWKMPGATKRGKKPLEAIEEILDLIENHIRTMVQPE
jgi:hypothetical protein